MTKTQNIFYNLCFFELFASLRLYWLYYGMKLVKMESRNDVITGFVSIAVFFVLTITIFFNKTYLDIIDRFLFEEINTSHVAVLWFLLIVMELGSVWSVLTYSLICFILNYRYLAGKILLTGFLASGMSTVVKFLIERGRPYDITGYEVIRRSGEWGYGYPSGHTATAAAIATILQRRASYRVKIILWVLVGLVAVGRIYAGVHSPLDILGGLSLGIAIGSIINLFLP